MRLLLPVVIAAALVATPANQVLVLRTGERIAISGEPRRDGDTIVFRSRSGALYSIAASDVDEKATLAAAETLQDTSTRSVLPKRLKGDAATKKRLLADLSKSRGTPVAPPPLPPPSAPGDAAADAAKEKALAAEEETWRRNARALDERVASAEARVEYLAEREKAVNDEILAMLALGHPQEHLGLQVRDLQDTKSFLEQARRDLEAAKQERARFQDDARRQGILPGWLR
ncbi:MAG: hypothetical protein ACYC7A_17910 [Thermoanaerobaculia bacterium]